MKTKLLLRALRAHADVLADQGEFAGESLGHARFVAGGVYGGNLTEEKLKQFLRVGDKVRVNRGNHAGHELQIHAIDPINQTIQTTLPEGVMGIFNFNELDIA